MRNGDISTDGSVPVNCVRIWPVIIFLIIFILLPKAIPAFAAGTVYIDDDSVITVEQAGSLAPNEGDYGWDSRGAQINYHSIRGSLRGSLGDIFFTNRGGGASQHLWDEWGYEFPDWWTKDMLERIRRETDEAGIAEMRDAFENSVVFECTWIIAIGLKGGTGLSKSLRTDGTLRKISGDLQTLSPPERLFKGDAMSGSLSSVLPHETWGAGTLTSFEERNPYICTVSIRSYDVEIYATNCTECAAAGVGTGSGECTHVKPGAYFCMQLPIVYEGSTYSGSKSFVWEGQTAGFDIPDIEGYERAPEKDILSGLHGSLKEGSITPTGDCRIYLGFYNPDDEAFVKPVDLTIKYVLMNSENSGAKKTVKESFVPGGIKSGEMFSIKLSDTIEAGGTEYELIENTTTALSYSANPRMSSALKGTKAYRIAVSSSVGGMITYASEEKYESDGNGVLYVPVKEVPPVDEEPDNQGEEDNNPVSTVPIVSKIGIIADDPMTDAAIKSEVFDPEQAVPSTESLYTEVSANDCLYVLNASAVSGNWPITVNVTFPYILRWTDDEGVQHEERESKSTSVTVYRQYAYIHLDSFAYYRLKSLDIGNPAMNPEKVSFNPEDKGFVFAEIGTPVSYGSTMPSPGGNIDMPLNFRNTVSTEVVVLEGDKERPVVPPLSSSSAKVVAERVTGQLQCRNDELFLAGNNVLGSSGWHTYSGGERINESALSQKLLTFDSRSILGSNAISIPAEKRNGLYRTGIRTVRYEAVIRYGGASIDYNPLLEVNDVNVHTPVICNPSIADASGAPNLSFDQEVNDPDRSRFTLLTGCSDSYGSEGHENDGSDFTISVQNSGNHPVYSGRLGAAYDYSHNVSGLNGGTYVMCNEVRFPFDVRWDTGNDYETSNDRRIAAWTWVSVGSGRQRFYIPDTVAEGDYTIEARSRAVNSLSGNDYVSTAKKNGVPYIFANTNPDDYVAAGSLNVHVAGRIYGLTLYDVASSAEWENVFLDGITNKFSASSVSGEYTDGTLRDNLPDGETTRKQIGKYVFYYTDGINNENGFYTGRLSKFTLPLVAGSNPLTSMKNRGMSVSGYSWRFRCTTEGSVAATEGAVLKIEPVFSAILPDGTRVPVDIYYSEYFKGASHSLVRIGSDTDRKNMRRIYAGDEGLAIPETYIENTAHMLEMTKQELIRQKASEYCYAEINALTGFVPKPGSNRRYWYFEYSLPSILHIVRKDAVFNLDGRVYPDFESYMRVKGTTDYSEDFWINKGYLVVNFNITLYDCNGAAHLRYISPNGYCNMWNTAGQPLNKADYYGRTFGLEFGDVVIVNPEESIASDYSVDHRY